MKARQKRIYVHGAGISIISGILLTLFFAGGICCAIFAQLVVGLIFLALLTGGTLYMLCAVPWYCDIYVSYVEVRTFFGRVKRRKLWADLVKIDIAELWANNKRWDEYLIFEFDEEITRPYEESFKIKTFWGAWELSNIIAIANRKGVIDIIRQYTDVPIEDQRKRQ